MAYPRRSIPDILFGAAIWAVMLSGVIIAYSVVRDSWPKSRAGSVRDREPRAVPRWPKRWSAQDTVWAPQMPESLYSLIFECPACGFVRTELAALRGRHPGDVAVVYRHFPPDGIHMFARDAALAAECAAEQGRFEQYHDLLFDAQDSLGLRPWKAFAVSAGVPRVEEFEKCIVAAPARKRVDADVAVGGQLRISDTDAHHQRAAVSRVADGGPA